MTLFTLHYITSVNDMDIQQCGSFLCTLMIKRVILSDAVV